MATPKTPKPPPHTHLLAATAKWSAFKKSMVDHATRTAAARADWEKEKVHRTLYYKAEHPQATEP